MTISRYDSKIRDDEFTTFHEGNVDSTIGMKRGRRRRGGGGQRPIRYEWVLSETVLKNAASLLRDERRKARDR